MITFKQLEAVYWIVKLGGFAQASQKLHTTQSAVSKRIQEVESLLHARVFDRSQRSARLTEVGEEVFVMAERLLDAREAHLGRLLKGEPDQKHVRIGVTEVTAMTWLPRFVDRIHEAFPRVTIDPEVDSGSGLRDKLLANEIDVMVAADAFRDDRFRAMPVGKLRLQWMAKSGLVSHARSTLRMQVLQSHRILTQGPQSGTGLLFQEWFRRHGLEAPNVVVSNSLIALIGLTVSGFGISYLPLASVQPMVQAGLLEVLNVKPSLPDAPYAALIRRDQRSSLISAVVRIAQETCDFSRLFQASTGPTDDEVANADAGTKRRSKSA